jgi:hypothetical protein
MDRREFLLQTARSSVLISFSGLLFSEAFGDEITIKDKHHQKPAVDTPRMQPGSCKDFSYLEREPKIYV